VTDLQQANSKAHKTILHLIDTTGPGGAETVFIQLADKMREMGYQSIVVIQGAGWVQDELNRRGIKPYVMPAKGSFAAGFLAKLVQLIRKHKIDLIQSHLLGSNVYAAMAGLITGTPVVATYHGMVDVNPNERFKFLKNQVMRFGINRYVAVSHRLMADIREQKLLDAKKASVIYNGVDLKLYNQPQSNEIRQQLKLPEDAFLVGSLGNIRPAKAYEVLISAAAIILKENKSVHFVIAGHKKQPLMSKLEKQINDLGVQENIHFIGFYQDCAKFLSQMNLFALSSSSEGFSIATIEAMAARLPVLVTKCGGPEEIVTDEENGLMIAPNAPEKFAEKLKRLIEDDGLQERLGDAGRRHVENVFSLDRMLQSYQDEYSKLIR
jgi:glycosyltransferase involved in cell wall biosynthesis